MTTFDKIRISTVNDRNGSVITKNYDTLPVKNVDKKTITAKNENFTFVGTFTKAKDVDDSKTFLFTGTGQLSFNKTKKLMYDGIGKKVKNMGKELKNIIIETVLRIESILGILKIVIVQEREKFINYKTMNYFLREHLKTEIL